MEQTTWIFQPIKIPSLLRNSTETQINTQFLKSWLHQICFVTLTLRESLPLLLNVCFDHFNPRFHPFVLNTILLFDALIAFSSEENKKETNRFRLEHLAKAEARNYSPKQFQMHMEIQLWNIECFELPPQIAIKSRSLQLIYTIEQQKIFAIYPREYEYHIEERTFWYWRWQLDLASSVRY